MGIKFVKPIDGAKANFWLNTIILDSKDHRDKFIQLTNEGGVMTRPTWRLMSELDMYKKCQTGDLKNSLWLQDRIVNISSSGTTNTAGAHIHNINFDVDPAGSGSGITNLDN